MAGIKPTLGDLTNSINKYISLIPMCFVSWFVWLMKDDPFFAGLLFIFGCWFVWPLIVWAIMVLLQSFWTKGFLWKIYLIWGCVIIILVGAYFISPAKFGNKCNPDIMAEHYDNNDFIRTDYHLYGGLYDAEQLEKFYISPEARSRIHKICDEIEKSIKTLKEQQ